MRAIVIRQTIHQRRVGRCAAFGVLTVRVDIDSFGKPLIDSRDVRFVRQELMSPRQRHADNPAVIGSMDAAPRQCIPCLLEKLARGLLEFSQSVWLMSPALCPEPWPQVRRRSRCREASGSLSTRDRSSRRHAACSGGSVVPVPIAFAPRSTGSAANQATQALPLNTQHSRRKIQQNRLREHWGIPRRTANLRRATAIAGASLSGRR